MECTTMMDGMGMMMFWGLITLLLTLLVLFLFILAATYAVKRIWGERPGGKIGDDESALDILKKRYAKGEISRQEFETMKKEIQ
jgi:putative membrane protein